MWLLIQKSLLKRYHNRKNERGLGMEKVLLQVLLEWAENNPVIEKVSLAVFIILFSAFLFLYSILYENGFEGMGLLVVAILNNFIISLINSGFTIQKTPQTFINPSFHQTHWKKEICRIVCSLDWFRGGLVLTKRSLHKILHIVKWIWIFT